MFQKLIAFIKALLLHVVVLNVRQLGSYRSVICYHLTKWCKFVKIARVVGITVKFSSGSTDSASRSRPQLSMKFLQHRRSNGASRSFSWRNKMAADRHTTCSPQATTEFIEISLLARCGDSKESFLELWILNIL